MGRTPSWTAFAEQLGIRRKPTSRAPAQQPKLRGEVHPGIALLGLRAPKGFRPIGLKPAAAAPPAKPAPLATTAVPVTPPPPRRSTAAAGALAERKRLAAILSSPAAQQAPELAKHLALRTDMPAAAAIAALADTQAAAAPGTPFRSRFNPYAHSAASAARARAEADDPRRFAEAVAKAVQLVDPDRFPEETTR